MTDTATGEPPAAEAPDGVPSGGSDPDATFSRVWRNGVLERENFPIEEISDYLRQEDCLVWADICTPGHHELEQIASELNLDPLAVEDAVSRQERPKADRYRTHLYVNTYAIAIDTGTGALRTAEIGTFVLTRALVTVRQEAWYSAGNYVRRWDANPELIKNGVSALLHGVLDCVVDSHFDAVETLDDAIEAIEDQLFENRPMSSDLQRRNYQLRKSLVQLRRVVLPTREVVNTLMRRDLHVIDADMTPYFQDVYDHVLRAAEWTESLRDMVSTIFETSLSLQDARLNNVVKRLSAWAAIVAVPTAITGFYGMNVPYPGYGHPGGFVAAVAVIVGLAGGCYVLFRKQGWL
jgi:magnesium transporter